MFEPDSLTDLQNVRILLHCCCAPCSTAILEWMLGAGLRPGVFFSNSNIFPFEEYEHRKSELIRYAAFWGLEVVEDEYDHGAWRSAVQGLEQEPERGPRCRECFKFRLLRAARYAAAHDYTVLTTTLASSRWKSLAQVDAAGRYACSVVNAEILRNHPTAARNGQALCLESVEPATGVTWWGKNWRKGGLQDRRDCLIREHDIYNQDYCGCEFSLPPDKQGTRPPL
ncbi:MAG: epoxyqueuosine reductase QueH [Candidatus Cryptobacteroides sp.]|jgi:predicted adenine nucleotide alpha hydrolase (AANH) superfamily ATPase